VSAGKRIARIVENYTRHGAERRKPKTHASSIFTSGKAEDVRRPIWGFGSERGTLKAVFGGR
jgi:hypothetical protein